jgi:hypothetical protein
MRKALGFLAVAVMALTLAAAAEQSPESVTIDACGPKQPEVTFDHAAHVKLSDCKTCHHTQADLTAASSATIDVKGCTECHVKPANAETPGCSDMSLTKNAFHIRCIDCHKQAVKADATKKAPTKCAECHVKG